MSFGLLDNFIGEMTGPMLKSAAKKWFDFAYASLGAAITLGVGAINTVLFLVSGTLLAKGALVSMVALQILTAYRIYQLTSLEEKLGQWNGFGPFISQVRQWSYTYPASAPSNPFLLQIEKKDLAL